MDTTTTSSVTHFVWKCHKDFEPSAEVLSSMKDAKRISVSAGSFILPDCPNLERLDVHGMTPEYMEYILAHPTIATLYIFLESPQSLDLSPLVHIRRLFVDMDESIDGYSKPLPPISLILPPNLTHLHMASVLFPCVDCIHPSVHFLEALPIRPAVIFYRENLRMNFLRRLCVDVISYFPNIKSFVMFNTISGPNTEIISALETHRVHNPFVQFEVGLIIFEHEEMRVLARCAQSLKVECIFLDNFPVLCLETYQTISASPLRSVSCRNNMTGGDTAHPTRVPFGLSLDWFSQLEEAHIKMHEDQPCYHNDDTPIPNAKIKRVILDYDVPWNWSINEMDTIQLLSRKFRQSLTCIVVRSHDVSTPLAGQSFEDRLCLRPVDGFECKVIRETYSKFTLIYTAVSTWSPKAFPAIAASEQALLRTLMLGITRAARKEDASGVGPKIKIGLADALEWSLEGLVVHKHEEFRPPPTHEMRYVINGRLTSLDKTDCTNDEDTIQFTFFNFFRFCTRLRNYTFF